MNVNEEIPKLTIEDLGSQFGRLLNCCLHTPVWTPADVDQVLCSVHKYSPDGWACTDEIGSYVWACTDEIGFSGNASYVVVQLKSGNFGLLCESSDYTGHGCECGAATSVYATASDVLRFGIIEDAARNLIWPQLEQLS